MSTATAPSSVLVELASPTWPTVPIGSDAVTIGRADSCSLRIAHASISRQHLRLHRDADHVVIEDLESRFGTFVNGIRVHKSVLRMNDTVRFGSSPPYRFDGRALTVMSEGTGMAVVLKDVAVSRGGRAILQHVNLAIDSGSFVGVLGPSGAGKTLLLGCLSSTIRPSEGAVEFDGGMAILDHQDYYRSKIGIVSQEDLVFNELTVDENLSTAALIRLSEKDTVAERVTAVLKEVGMAEHRHKLASVLSGGQRKRVSVAVELLLRPRLLLLDEPTSGLDPAMQARIMEMLRGLAHQGVSVVCTTHTLDTVGFFDAVVVLGRHEESTSVSYFGDPRRLLSAFNVQDQADLFETLQDPGSSPDQGIEISNAVTTPSKEGNTGERLTRLRPEANSPAMGGSRRWRQTQVVWARSLRTMVRDPASAALAGLQPGVLATLALLSQSNHSDAVFSMFFLAMSSLWLGMTLTVRELVRERKLYVRDRLAGLDPNAYLGGKVFYGFTIVALQAAMIWIVARVLAPTMLNPLAADDYANTSWLIAWPGLLAIGLAGAILGLIVSVFAKTERVAVSLLPLVLIPQMLFSRVAYGDGGQGWGWTEPSPYAAIVHGFAAQQGGSATPSSEQLANFLISMPMISRPGTAVLALPSQWERNVVSGDVVLGEALYLMIVITAYGLGLYLAFRRMERRWTELRG